MTRHGRKISDVGIRGSKDPEIQYKLEFEGWEAAVAAGATLEELHKWYDGGYPRKFMALVIQWNRSHQLVEAHKQDAVRPRK